MSKTHEAEIICTNIIGAFPDKSLDDFLDMVEYAGFMADIPVNILLKVAHKVYKEHQESSKTLYGNITLILL